MSDETFFILNATSEIPIQQIQDLLNEKAGIERALIDIDDGEVKIEYDENKISLENIYSLLEKNDLNSTNNSFLK